MRVCVCACACACVRVRVCVCARACVRVCVHATTTTTTTTTTQHGNNTDTHKTDSRTTYTQYDPPYYYPHYHTSSTRPHRCGVTGPGVNGADGGEDWLLSFFFWLCAMSRQVSNTSFRRSRHSWRRAMSGAAMAAATGRGDSTRLGNLSSAHLLLVAPFFPAAAQNPGARLLLLESQRLTGTVAASPGPAWTVPTAARTGCSPGWGALRHPR